jgi:hypothetical protein
VVSVELRNDEKTRAAAQLLERLAGARRFRAVLGVDSTTATVHQLGVARAPMMHLGFIDGAHDEKSVRADIRLCLAAGCRYFLLDDWFPHWGPGVRPAVVAEGLVPIAILGGMALCIPSSAVTFTEEP